ncbi:lysophospholipase L1-like esterase [Sinorhizobium terangae]|uniref:SGNH hydrolase-type esterase domain-containing protein n=1 Tax=Sinorhizobium terangae TaxID=110322 RepID=A0A6N7LNS2_SINTE|nr:GDSL-type esterase/lipase family protein [Sinorhizobium terangae]MBB4185818.1 lysophospholipase L1-like esterase [Sinorhizobium terangae]MQX19387.1 hypothetical protein [Sinorhizobium terangae]
MSLFTKTAESVFAPYNSDGTPREIEPLDAQVWGTETERLITSFQAGGGIIFPDKATMDATLTYAANQMAWVMGDATVANNGIYRKIGASGSGSWVRMGDLPFPFIPATDVGAGTPNAIQATSSLPASESALIWVSVFEPNTGTPVTISFNGGAVLTIKTNAGNNPAAGGISGILLGRIVGNTFRLVSDQVSAAVLAAAEAAQAEAENARDTAVAAAGSLVVTRFATKADLEGMSVSSTAKSAWLAGYNTISDNKGGTYCRVNAQPSHGDWIRSTDRYRADGVIDATNGGYWERLIDERRRSDNAALLQFHKKRMQDGEAVRVLPFGDSLTAGTGADPGFAYPAQLWDMCKLYYKNTSIVFGNAGVGGNTSQQLISRYATDVTSFAPDIVILMVGMNDANPDAGISVETYEANLSRLVSMMKRDGYAVVMGDITPRKRMNNTGPQFVDVYRKACHRVAASHGVHLVPLNDIITDLVSSKNGYSFGDLTSDGIHYTNAGYELMAGAFLAYALATEPLNVRCGAQKDMLGSHVVPVGNAVVTYVKMEDNAVNSKEAATLRYTATDNASNLVIYLWVENYEYSDLVLYLTRERHATLTPSLLLTNLDIPGDTANTFTLGTNVGGGSTGRAISVPLRACRLRPGLNRINMRVTSTQTAEFAKFSVTPVPQDFYDLRGLFDERYSGANVPYSSEAGALDYNAVPVILGARMGIKAVKSGGGRTVLGRLETAPENASTWMSRYRIRGKMVDGLVLELGEQSNPGREHTPLVEYSFAKTSGTVWTVTATFRAAGGNIVITTVAVTVTNTNNDLTLTLFFNRTDTSLYLDSVTGSPITVPFALGPAFLVARNAGASDAVFNPPYRLGTGGYNTLVDGEEWIDFAASTFSTVIGGVKKSVALA